MELLNSRLMKSCTSAHRQTYVPPRTQKVRKLLLCAQSTTLDTVFPLEAGCSVSKAAIGFNSAGYRGLLATEDISQGDVVLSIPLHNMLPVPRQLTQPHMATAAAAALATWQQHHGQLSEALLAFFLNPDVIWEAKLVAWLLHLRAAAPAGSLWDSYCQSLPAAAEAVSFCSYSEEHAEQLQFIIWKALANKQRQLLETVQQQCQAACLHSTLRAGNTTTRPDSSSSGRPSSDSTSRQQEPGSQDYAWALSMVKSRTFGQKLPMQGCTAAAGLQQDQLPTPTAAAQTGATEQAAAAAAAAAAAGCGANRELEDDDSDVFLLMAPFIDMINHAPNNNCSFGIDAAGTSFSVRCSSSGGIQQGQEITISYGSNKSNLALLSCYGFQLPGNLNDAQLVAPIFKSCLAAAGSLEGFDPAVVQQAEDRLNSAGPQLWEQQLLDPQLHDQGDQGQGLQELQSLLTSELIAARRRCALACLPADPKLVQQRQQQQQQQQQQEEEEEEEEDVLAQLTQQQRYLAQLMLYQLSLIFKRCGTGVVEDALQLQELQKAAASSSSGGSDGDCGSSCSGLEAAICQQAVLARLEHKLLLRECEGLLQEVLLVLDAQQAVLLPK